MLPELPDAMPAWLIAAQWRGWDFRRKLCGRPAGGSHESRDADPCAGVALFWLRCVWVTKSLLATAWAEVLAKFSPLPFKCLVWRDVWATAVFFMITTVRRDSLTERRTRRGWLWVSETERLFLLCRALHHTHSISAQPSRGTFSEHLPQVLKDCSHGAQIQFGFPNQTSNRITVGLRAMKSNLLTSYTRVCIRVK